MTRCLKCGSPRLRAEAVQLSTEKIKVYTCLICNSRFTRMELAPPDLKAKPPLSKICEKAGFTLAEEKT